jgi:hypothetical protein
MRIIFYYLLPLLLPLAVYLGWVWLSHRRGRDGTKAVANLAEGPVFWLILAGFLLMAGSLITWALTSGEGTGGTYEAPRYEDGRVIPGRVLH